MAKTKTEDPTGKVEISTEPETTPATEPAREPSDTGVKKLLDQITSRLSTVEADIVKGTKRAQRQKGDLEKLRDFILEDVTLSMDDLAAKAKSVDLPAKMKSPKLDIMVAVSGFLPLDSLFDIFRGSKHGTQENE